MGPYFGIRVNLIENFVKKVTHDRVASDRLPKGCDSWLVASRGISAGAKDMYPEKFFVDLGMMGYPTVVERTLYKGSRHRRLNEG